MEHDPVRKAFNVAASLYKYRLPYHRQFFEQLAGRLSLTGRERVLDLCCGDGQIIAGLTGRVQQAVGVDFSEEMIRRAPALPNVEYHHLSVEAFAASPMAANTKFELLTVGHGIHWIRPGPLARVLEQNLAPHGRVVILGNQWSEETPWLSHLRRVEAPYRSFEVSDVSGRRKLGALGFVQTDRFAHHFKVSCDLRFLMNHVTSYARYAERIMRTPHIFAASLEQALRPHLNAEGKLDGVASNWACVYAKG